MECPDCKGYGLVPITFPHNRDFTAIICVRCHGEKVVSDRTPEWMEMGKILKSTRIEKRMTLRNVCKKLNLDVVLASEMERGIVEPDLSLYDKL